MKLAYLGGTVVTPYVGMAKKTKWRLHTMH